MTDLSLFTDREKIALLKSSLVCQLLSSRKDTAEYSEDIQKSFSEQLSPTELYSLLLKDNAPKGFGEIINKKTPAETDAINNPNK